MQNVFCGVPDLLRPKPDQGLRVLRRDDGGDIPDGEYDVREGEDERRQVEEVGWEVANKVASPMEPAILTDVVKKGAFAGVPLE
jgi:hypothetical protein